MDSRCFPTVRRDLKAKVTPRSVTSPKLSTLLEDSTGNIQDVLSRFAKTTDCLKGRDTHEEALAQAQRIVSKERFKFRYSRPWENSSDGDSWGQCRILCGKIVLSQRFDWLLVVVILCNLVQIVYETNLEATCYPEYKDNLKECPHNGNDDPFLATASMVFVIIYSVEAMLKIYVERLEYFKQHENILDFGVCVTSLATTALDSFVDVSWLRILRVCRLIRVFNLIANIPELRMICVGFAGSMRAIFFGGVLIVVMLSLSAILLVQYIHPVATEIDFGQCERCDRGFSSVQDAVLTLYQQIITGDSWGQISIPIIEKSPILGVTLCAIQLIVGVGAMNLILAVVVDRAVEAREANKDHVLHQRLKDTTARKVHLIEKIAAMDTDSSGSVSRDEIQQGITNFLGKAYSYDIHRALILADVTEDDLLFAFDLLDQNADNEVSYLQLCDVLDEFQAADVRKLSVLSRLHLNKLESRVCKQDITLEKIDIKLGKLLAGASLRPSHSASQGTCIDSSTVWQHEETNLSSALAQELGPKVSEALGSLSILEAEVAMLDVMQQKTPSLVDTVMIDNEGLSKSTGKATCKSVGVKRALAPHSDQTTQANACQEFRRLTERCCASLRRDLEDIRSVALNEQGYVSNGSKSTYSSKSPEGNATQIQI